MPPPAKPLDFGSGRVAASFDATSAAWLSIGMPHASRGFVELSALPQFDERLRGDPTATRSHRLAMTDGGHAFLAVELDGRRPALRPTPEWTGWEGDAASVRLAAGIDAGTIRQEWHVRLPGTIRLRLVGRLDRPALAEVTELAPPTPTGARTRIAVDDGVLLLTADGLPAEARVRVVGSAVVWTVDGEGAVGTLARRDGEGPLRFVVHVGFGRVGHGGDRVRASGGGDRLEDRALTYIRQCTALATGERERVILTDHRILPLSWTRDAYWQALALLAADGPGDRRRVADHLRWLWRRCERPDARWVRSHHANGRRKDLAFQADQQLYPLVELADYWRFERALPDGVAWGREVERAWGAALAEVDSRIGLIASTENAADDPAVAPFIAASQILLWYAAERTAELARSGVLALDGAQLSAAAAAVRDAFARHIVPPGGGPWPYAVDGHGTGIVYHDANDLPIALAPIWGFCAPDDGGWRVTTAFAFSPDNPGWVDGSRPGLGSAHTSGAWTLGDVQAWLRARTAGDARAARDALRRLEEVAFDDGMLPEAYGADGDARVRHWFAWPGAALAALRILDRRGALSERLSALPDARIGA